MANVSRINGFKPVKHLNGSSYNGQSTRYFIPAADGTAVYIGDAVKLAGSADTDGTTPTAQLAAAGDAICGIVVSVEPNPDNFNVGGTFRAASTARYVLVADAPDIIFEVESSNGTPASADIGLNINHAVGTPSTTTGRSGATVDVGTKAVTATLTFKIRNFVPRPENEVGASAKFHVLINNHQFGASTGSAGV